jgi:hypothetical protein
VIPASNGTLAQTVLALVTDRPLTLIELLTKLPDVSLEAIRQALVQLQADGLIAPLGMEGG